MNKRQIAVAVIVLLAALFAGRTLAQGPALPPGEYDLEAGQYVFSVPELAVPTETPIPPTGTPELNGHDDRAWHPLTEAFGHEHKADPHSVDDIFGVQFYEWAGGEISYPWETPNENANKHEFYGWLVERNAPKIYNQYVSDYRVQYHGDVAAIGALNRFH